MPLSSALKFRNKNIKATYAIITDNTVTCKTGTPITPFTPVSGLSGVPFKDSGTGASYYEYFVDPSSSPLPAGLSLNPTTGQITGTPTATTVVSAVAYSTICKIGVRDSRNRKAYKESTLTFIVLDELVAVNTTNNKVVGVVNSVNADVTLFTSVTGGRPPYVYSVAVGALPTDVIIDQPTGKLTGKSSDTKRTFTDPSQTEVLPITVPVEITVEDFYGTKVTNHTIVDFDIIDLIIATPAQADNFEITGVIPLTVNFHAFSSVVAGTPPYTYFKSTKQSGATPDGLTLDTTTGDITGVYAGGTATKTVGGVVVPDLKEYTGTLKVSVKDSTDAIASKIANVKIKAYLPFVVETLDTLPAGGPQTTYDAVKLKPISHTPFKGFYGVPPYTFRLVSYKYTDKLGAITTSSSLPTGVTLTATNGKLETTAGLLTGTHEFVLDAVDTTNAVATGFVPIIFNVSDAVAATSLATVKSYEMYVGDTSALTTGVDILSADLGIPPYTFSVAPALPAGLTLSTTATKCTLIGTATAPTDTSYVFSVKDSTNTTAKVTETIALKIVDHFTSSANITDIEAFIDDLVEPIDIFDSFTGGYPPYTVTLLTGTLRPELTIVPMDFTYYDTAKAKTITTTAPQIWGNIMITGAAGSTPILGADHKYGYASMDTYTFKVTDSKGNVSPNIATINYKIYKRLRGTATNIPPVVTGIAEFTNVSFSPITPNGGIPPYTINFTSSVTDTRKKPPVKTTLPKLGLKAVQPNTIAGIPNAGYSGPLYYYMSDSVGSRTDNIPVKFNITPKISAVLNSAPFEVMFVRGYDKFEITDKTGASPVVTTNTELKIPFFKSVSGGAVPYKYFEAKSTGAVAATSFLPTGFNVDTFGNLVCSSTTPPVFPTKSIYCTVVDNNLVSGGAPGSIKLTVKEEFTTTLVDNLTDNLPAVTSFNNTKSNNSVVFLKNSNVTSFSLVKGKNGSGRYAYIFDTATPSTNNVSDFFQINLNTGVITLKPSAGGTAFNSLMDVTFGIKVKDTFSNVIKTVSNVFNLKVVDPLAITAVNPNVSFEKDSVLTNQPLFNITGGSGQYDLVSITGPSSETTFPGTFTLSSTSATDIAGRLTGTANVISGAKDFIVRYKDRVYNNTVQASIRFSITSDYVIIPVLQSNTAKSVSLSDVQVKSGKTYAQLLSTPIKIRIDVEGNVRSSSSTIAALTVNLASGLNSGTTVKVLTKTGSIIGYGGKGGDPTSSSQAARNGGDGGPGLKLNTGTLAVEIESLPGTFITGGGGGGGAGGTGWVAIEGTKMYVYKTKTFYGYQERLVGTVWSQQSSWSSNDRGSWVIDNTYEQLKPYFPSEVRSASDDYSIPDPAHPTDPNWRFNYKAYNYTPYSSLDFSTGTGTGTGITWKLQNPVFRVEAQNGGVGGNGYGFQASGVTTISATNGVAGVKNTTPYSGMVESLPTVNLTNISTTTYGNYTAQGLIVDGALVMAGNYHNDITPATAGEGSEPGLPGNSIDVSGEVTAYKYAAGLGGGGGGGKGGAGGDGGKPSDLPPGYSSSLYKSGGIGGFAGNAIETTASTDLPTLITPSLVFGEVV